MAEPLEENRFTALLEHAQDIIIVVDASGTISYVNPALERTMGFTPAEMVGENAFEYMHPDDREKVWERFQELIERPDGATERVRHRLKHKSGEWRWVESIGSNLSDDALDGFVINVRDIADRMEREAELQRQNDRLQEFASIVAHDLRNPLNVASGELELAREGDDEHLEAVAEAHDRIAALIDDLLTLAQGGQQVGDVEPVDVAALIGTCWRTVETGDATLVTAIDRTVMADRSRLQQLLENLVRNAVEHGGAEVTVTVGELDEGFYVEDDGPGIPPGDRDRILDAGYTTTDGGTGFGLAIVAEIAQAHGWSVRVSEGADGGARFEFTGIETPE